VAEALALTLLPAEKNRLTSARTVNPDSYEAYLKGSALWRTLKPADLDAAQRYFRSGTRERPVLRAGLRGADVGLAGPPADGRRTAQ